MDEDLHIDLTVGVRNLLLGAGVTWPIALGPIVQNWDAAISLTPYAVEDDTEVGTVITGIQVRMRGNKNAGIELVSKLQGRIFKLLDLRDVTLNGVHIPLAWRQVSAPMGLDGAGRTEIADSYYFRSDRLGRAG